MIRFPVTCLVVAAVAPTLAGCGIDPSRVVPVGPTRSAVTLATPAQIAAGAVVEGSYLVAFRAPGESTRRAHASYALEYRHHYSYLAESYLSEPGVRAINYITTVDLANPRDTAAAGELDPPAALRLAWGEDDVDEVPAALAEVSFAGADVAPGILSDWEARGALWYAEPNYVNTLQENPYTKAMVDAYTAESVWWHTSIKLPKALEKIAGSELAEANVPVVAVLDSGVDVQHAALKDHMWTNDQPGASGCAGDVNGCDTTTAKKGALGSGAVQPYLTTAYAQDCPYAGTTDKGQEQERGVCQHGTHVAGIVAATVGGGIGGVCPVCKIMAIKIITAIKGRGAASDSAILNGFKYLTLFRTANGGIVRVANSSFGKYVRARSVALLVSVLKKAPNEILVVGAAGNEDSMARSYPAALNDAIAVSAVRSDDSKAPYSNFGPWVDVSAPGGDGLRGDPGTVTSSIPGGDQIEGKRGTSMAAPVVAGIAGLVLSVDPRRSFQALRDSLISTADCRVYNPDIGGGMNRTYYYPKLQDESVRRPLLGSGIVDAEAAIDNKSKSGCVGASLKRVTRGCSTVRGGGGADGDDGPGGVLMLVLAGLVLPMLSGLRGSRGRSCSM